MIILNSGIGNYVRSNGKKYSYFGGNNYLGLANHPLVREASIKAIRKYGVSFSASRRTTGTADLHLELERQIASFKGEEDSVVYASGYQGNGILLEILNRRISAVFTDQFSHSSIVAAIPGDLTAVKYYDHCDAEHLGRLLEMEDAPNPLIITDGIFALTGEIAPLDRIYPLLSRHNAMLIVDDAHATGVLGKTGKGTPEHFDLPGSDHIFQTETMSKAFGSYGGFISGSTALTDSIRNGSATYQASTALPPAVVAAGIASLKIVRENPALQIQLREKAGWLRREIAGTGFTTTPDETPIIPIMLSGLKEARNLSFFLEENSIIAPFIEYPSKLEKQIVRIAVSVNHTEGQMDRLLGIMKKWHKRYGKNQS